MRPPRRSRDLSTGTTNPRTTGDRSVERSSLGKRAVGPEQQTPGGISGNLLGERIIRIKHLHEEMLPYPPAASGGGATESFRAQESHSGDLTGTTGTIPFQWGSNLFNYHTANVSGLDTSATEVTVPGGIWIFSLSLRLFYFSATANAGSMIFYFRVDGDVGTSAAEVQPYDDIGDPVTLTAHLALADWSIVEAYFTNSLNNSGTHVNPRISDGSFMGTRIGSSDGVTYST